MYRLSEIDPEIKAVINEEKERQMNQIEHIASENLV